MSRRDKQINRIVKEAFRLGAPQNRVTKNLSGGKVESQNEPVLIRKTPLMWGIPCDEVMYADFFILFEKHANKMPWDGFAASKGTYLPKARNFIHDSYLEMSNLPYLMMLDSDILFPPYVADRLMAHKLPIVGGWYRDKVNPTHHPVVYDFVSEEDTVVFKHRDKEGEGLEKVDGMGAGIWLLTREVAEKLGKSPYDMNSGGEDLKLSRQLMKLGIPLHVDWSINCAHAGVFHI